MLPARDGSIRLFRYSGIQVSLHWTWFLAAAYFFSTRGDDYSSPVWNLVEYLALFVIVLMHEFGHSLACRSTGGRSEDIVLWPLGGIAFVAPPQRPGAQLWSIAAGPLVNVALAPVLYLVVRVAAGRGLHIENPDLFECLVSVRNINLGLLIFNMLPIYPLDGGQILRSLLWFGIGPVNSLLVATVLGFLGGGALVAGALYAQWRFPEGRWLWMAFIGAFLLFNCVQAFRQARLLRAQLAERDALAPGRP